jgi:hypothetical protein
MASGPTLEQLHTMARRTSPKPETGAKPHHLLHLELILVWHEVVLDHATLPPGSTPRLATGARIDWTEHGWVCTLHFQWNATVHENGTARPFQDVGEDAGVDSERVGLSTVLLRPGVVLVAERGGDGFIAQVVQPEERMAPTERMPVFGLVAFALSMAGSLGVGAWASPPPLDVQVLETPDRLVEMGFLVAPECHHPDRRGTFTPMRTECHPGPIVMGANARPDVVQEVRRHDDESATCVARWRSKHPELAGRVTIRFVIGKTGAVAKADVSASNLQDPEVERCLATSFEHFVFPPLPEGGGIAIVTYPLVFFPE